jgi:hypothetical protein
MESIYVVVLMEYFHKYLADDIVLTGIVEEQYRLGNDRLE